MKMAPKFTFIFQGNTILIPLVQPVLLKGTREDKNFAFIFNYNEANYYIFTTLQDGVINNNLPEFIDETTKNLLIESVNKYSDHSRQGLANNIFVTHRKKNGLSS